MCRYIDALMVNNHLRAFSGKSYVDKMKLLARVGLSIPQTVHELVIVQRNDIEHGYQAATAVQASEAVDLAELLLERSTTLGEIPKKALIPIGSNIRFQVNDKAPDFGEVRLSADDPWLLINNLADAPRVMVLYPQHDEVAYAQLREFDVEQTVILARLMRESAQASLGSFTYKGQQLQGLLYQLGRSHRPADREA